MWSRVSGSRCEVQRYANRKAESGLKISLTEESLVIFSRATGRSSQQELNLTGGGYSERTFSLTKTLARMCVCVLL